VSRADVSHARPRWLRHQPATDERSRIAASPPPTCIRPLGRRRGSRLSLADLAGWMPSVVSSPRYRGSEWTIVGEVCYARSPHPSTFSTGDPFASTHQDPITGSCLPRCQSSVGVLRPAVFHSRNSGFQSLAALHTFSHALFVDAVQLSLLRLRHYMPSHREISPQHSSPPSCPDDASLPAPKTSALPFGHRAINPERE